MIRDLKKAEFPDLLKEIPDPPKQLRYSGELPTKNNKILAVVGSRKYSSYGREMCESIIRGLRGYPITIVSGLALGIDSIAHRSALSAGLQTIAVPGSGLATENMYPQSHVHLAYEIIHAGGGLLSEFPDDTRGAPWTFPQRNRIMAGMSHATLVIEAEQRSGTLITSRLATEYNRDVGTVPGPVTSSTSEGPHMLIRLGATLIRDSKDVLELLGIKEEDTSQMIRLDTLTDEERIIVTLLSSPMPRNRIVNESGLDIGLVNATLSLLEIKGIIIEELGEIRRTTSS